MIILTSELTDMPEIFRLYDLATNFQKLKFPDHHWPKFEAELITSEIAENRQFKYTLINIVLPLYPLTNSNVRK